MRITKKADVRKAIDEAIKTKNVVVMDFRVEGGENVYPMVPAGGVINKMLGVDGLA